MSDNVVGLKGTPIAANPNEPVPDVVSMLEDLLERAKAGRIRAVAYAVTYDSNTTGKAYSTGWEGGHATSTDLQAAIACLGYRYNKAHDDHED